MKDNTSQDTIDPSLTAIIRDIARPIAIFFGFLISILAICSMFAVIGIKKRLDEQTIVSKKMLAAIESLIPASIEEQLMKRYGITKEGNGYCFLDISYTELSEAVNYAKY